LAELRAGWGHRDSVDYAPSYRSVNSPHHRSSPLFHKALINQGLLFFRVAAVDTASAAPAMTPIPRFIAHRVRQVPSDSATAFKKAPAATIRPGNHAAALASEGDLRGGIDKRQNGRSLIAHRKIIVLIACAYCSYLCRGFSE
jgi:hypothetical protein